MMNNEPTENKGDPILGHQLDLDVCQSQDWGGKTRVTIRVYDVTYDSPDAHLAGVAVLFNGKLEVKSLKYPEFEWLFPLEGEKGEFSPSNPLLYLAFLNRRSMNSSRGPGYTFEATPDT